MLAEGARGEVVGLSQPPVHPPRRERLHGLRGEGRRCLETIVPAAAATKHEELLLVGPEGEEVGGCGEVGIDLVAVHIPR